MEVFRRLPPPADRRPCALTIGNFDGVHRGHQVMLAALRARADELGLPACVLTFEPHPREFFAVQRALPAPARILTERDKLDALARSRIDRVCIAHFNESLATLSAERFISEMIVDGLQARYLLVGDDFRFGARRVGDFELLAERAAGSGFELARMASVCEGADRISSSAVRAALGSGDFARVSNLLGRRYSISGHVIHGRQLGRDLGFPTLNLRIPFERPALSGIFVVEVEGLGDRALPGVANLGTRPAVERDGRPLLEVHLFDFDREIYGDLVRVVFLAKLRDEANFADLGALREQIARDTLAARAFFEPTSESGRMPDNPA
jgi:riboflavin kinase/FMN adenylyltransferase